MEQCQQDLETLSAWGNLATIQDTRRVASIEEFKNKKFRYQLTETTVEIERMVIRRRLFTKVRRYSVRRSLNTRKAFVFIISSAFTLFSSRM